MPDSTPHGGSASYDHRRYRVRRRILRWLIHNVGYRWLARYDGADGLDHLAAQGPQIVYFNHIAFIDPIIVLSSVPRDSVPLARHDVYSVPLWGVFPRIWGVIPVRRGEVDRAALRGALQVLRAGETVLIAPEGTRSPMLQRGKVGLAYMGARSQATLVPAAVEGTTGYPSLSLARRRQGGARVRFGQAFRFRPEFSRPGRDALRKMTDEAMYRLAALLPESRRGVYAELTAASVDTLDFV